MRNSRKKYMQIEVNMANLENYECDGQMNLADYMDNKFPVIIKGMMDDPYCPRCNCQVYDDIDEGKCHYCKLKLDFTPWYNANVKE